MATPRRKAPTIKIKDPAQAANELVLEQRQARIDATMRVVPDLGLDLNKPETAAEFLRDSWDKAAFGEEPKTVTKIVYGPDPLLDSCPAFKEAIEKNGKDAYAEATAAAIRRFEHRAVPDPVMQRGLFAAIKKFGVEAVADAFRDRILKIPEQTVEYELDGDIGGDPMLLGSNALRDCITRYGEPGKAYKFLSQRCMDVLGMRGYTLVLDKKGNHVKAGTLFLGWIPQHIADRRREHYARESEEAVRIQEDAYMDAQERLVRSVGAIGKGSRPLNPNERVKANASESEEMLGGEYEMGLHIERDT
jgi:hypothetical protein